MPAGLVLINGLPGSGKSTLAASLADTIGATLLSKDLIKESLAASIHGPAPGTIGAVAMDTVWSLARDMSGTVLIDSWWYRPRDLEFARAGIARVAASAVVELWCVVDSEVARQRYASRSRNAIHRDGERLQHDFADWARHATPLGLTPCIRVDTSRPVDVSALSEQLLALR